MIIIIGIIRTIRDLAVHMAGVDGPTVGVALMAGVGEDIQFMVILCLPSLLEQSKRQLHCLSKRYRFCKSPCLHFVHRREGGPVPLAGTRGGGAK